MAGPRLAMALSTLAQPGNGAVSVVVAMGAGLSALVMVGLLQDNLERELLARLPERGLPEAMGRLLRVAAREEEAELVEGLRREGFIKERITVDSRQLLDYLAPFVEPTKVDRFRFSREWMRTQFARINDPRNPAYTVGMKLNLPPSYLLIHRTWLAGVGVLCQLECEAPFRQILTESLPGFADPA